MNPDIAAKLYLSLPLVPRDESLKITDISVLRSNPQVRYRDFAKLSEEFPRTKGKKEAKKIYPVIISVIDKQFRVPDKLWDKILTKAANLPSNGKLFPLMARIAEDGDIQSVSTSNTQEECDYLKYIRIVNLIKTWEIISRIDSKMKIVMNDLRSEFIDIHIGVKSKVPEFHNITICLIKLKTYEDCLFAMVSDSEEGIFNKIPRKMGGYIISHHECLFCSRNIKEEKIFCHIDIDQSYLYLLLDEKGNPV